MKMIESRFSRGIAVGTLTILGYFGVTGCSNETQVVTDADLYASIKDMSPEQRFDFDYAGGSLNGSKVVYDNPFFSGTRSAESVTRQSCLADSPYDPIVYYIETPGTGFVSLDKEGTLLVKSNGQDTLRFTGYSDPEHILQPADEATIAALRGVDCYPPDGGHQRTTVNY